LATCFASLSELGAQLTESDWKTPTDCPGWTVQDNLSHLVGIERVLNGLPGTSHRAPASGHVKNPIGEANENEIDSRRGLSGAQVLAEWNEIATARLNTLRNADEAYFAVEAMTPTGPGTVADFLHIRVLDCWVHEQDM
ncbi:MAG: maleylpyruvate isomerase N-terminal domain-containing protein, partial [Actinomycetes bacterium]